MVFVDKSGSITRKAGMPHLYTIKEFAEKRMRSITKRIHHMYNLPDNLADVMELSIVPVRIKQVSPIKAPYVAVGKFRVFGEDDRTVQCRYLRAGSGHSQLMEAVAHDSEVPYHLRKRREDHPCLGDLDAPIGD